MQDYKSLCAAVMICATLVNIQTDTDSNDEVLEHAEEQRTLITTLGQRQRKWL